MPDQTLPQRTLRTSFALAVLLVILFCMRGENAIAVGVAVGAVLGMASLWSLTFAIPRLFSSASPAAKFLLGLLTFSKLPFYAIVLNFAMTSKLVSPFAVFCGVAMIPTVIVLKVLGFQMVSRPALGARPANSLGD